MSADIEKTIATFINKKGIYKTYENISMKKFINLLALNPYSEIIIHVDYKDDGQNEYRGTNHKEARKAFEAFLE